MGFITRIPHAFRQLGMPWLTQPAATPVNVSRASCTVGREDTSLTVSPLNAPGNTITFKSTYSPSQLTAASANSGRVVISGRMSDVCAELDRLVALETQPTLH